MKYFGEELKSLLRRLYKYRNNCAYLLMFFGPWAAFAFGLSTFTPIIVEAVGAAGNLVYLLFRVLGSVSPLIPTLCVWHDRDHFNTDLGITDGIMDGCFTIWFIAIVYFWLVK